MEEQKNTNENPQTNAAVVDGHAIQVGDRLANQASPKGNPLVYWIGFILRLVGLLGVAYVLILVIPSGVFFEVMFFVYWPIGISSLLALAIGHYLASNWKPQK